MRNGWLSIGLAVCLGAACAPEMRQLSTKEKLVSVLPGDDPEITAKLETGCKVIGTVRDAPTSAGRSLGTALGTAFGARQLCLPGIADYDDIRRCAGEHQSQVVQIIGKKTETTNHQLLVLFLMVANGWASGVAQNVGSQNYAMVTASNAQELDNWAENAVQTRTVALDLRLWRCPGSRAEPAKGELVWRREKATRLDLLQDGQVVGEAADLDRLPALVAAHPQALNFANEAVAHESSAYTKLWVGVPFAVLALASDVVAVVGLVKKNYPLGLGALGGGILFTSISVPVLFSGISSERRAQTSAMNAVDAWNDDYIHGKDTGRSGSTPAAGKTAAGPEQ